MWNHSFSSSVYVIPVINYPPRESNGLTPITKEISLVIRMIVEYSVSSVYLFVEDHPGHVGGHGKV